MRTYNLFRRKGASHLICAVPTDCTVPDFLAGTAWEFDRTVMEPGAAPLGFDAEAAHYGVRFNGFYLFQAFSE
jgi:hypothetical protein